MRKTSSLSIVERASAKWWFYLILVVLFFLPAYAQHSFNPQQTSQVIVEVLAHAMIYSLPWLFPLFKLVAVVVIVLVLVRPARFTRLFFGWAAFNLFLTAVFEDMAVTPTYGFVVITGNVVVYTLISLVFAWAALRGPDLHFARLPWWRYWVVPFALLAFWFPVNTTPAAPVADFSLSAFFLNGAGLTLCMMLPVYLAVLTLASPAPDFALLRLAGFAGLITGLLNVSVFLTNPLYGWPMIIAHSPLVLISLSAFVLGLRRQDAPTVSSRPGQVHLAG